jgi:ABC-type bacteriocin/lantibiotic exporter with double-glycine peptidase domain
MKNKKSILTIQPVLQKIDCDCGSACFMSVLGCFYKKRPIYKNTTREEVIIRTNTTNIGMDEIGLKKAAKYFNLSYKEFENGTITLLEKYLKLNRPIMAHISISGSHWIVVMGINRKNNVITLMDPAYENPTMPDRTPGIRTMSIDKFNEYWTIKDKNEKIENYFIVFSLGKQRGSQYK